MKRVAILSILAVLACSCSTSRPTVVATTAVDSTRVAVRTEYIERVDTVFVTLPKQKAESVTADSMSIVETDYAIATATVLPDGRLRHDLATKQQPLAVQITTTAVRVDSIAEREVEIPVPYEVERRVNELTWWQQTQIYGFRALVIVLVVVVVVRYRKEILALLK